MSGPNGLPILGQRPRDPAGPFRMILVTPQGGVGAEPGSLRVPDGVFPGVPPGTIVVGDPGAVVLFGCLFELVQRLRNEVEALKAAEPPV